jgi:hypothetical protein
LAGRVRARAGPVGARCRGLDRDGGDHGGDAYDSQRGGDPGRGRVHQGDRRALRARGLSTRQSARRHRVYLGFGRTGLAPAGFRIEFHVVWYLPSPRTRLLLAQRTLTQFRAYLDCRLPLLGGEPVGALTWVYDGERFVDGVFDVSCAGCKQTVWRDDDCPRCHAVGALAGALAASNSWPVPAACPRCDREEVRYLAMVPARVVYEGKRADKARTSTELHEP